MGTTLLPNPVQNTLLDKIVEITGSRFPGRTSEFLVGRIGNATCRLDICHSLHLALVQGQRGQHVVGKHIPL